MKIAVASCFDYRDAWPGFFGLLEKFWPGHPQAYLLTDSGEFRAFGVKTAYDRKEGLDSWGPRLATFARAQTEEILLMQEDFFLSAPVQTDLVEWAIDEMRRRGSASIRLYPCPGADIEYANPYFGIIARDAGYRVSLQATIWRPDALAKIASRFHTPTEFEMLGTQYAREFIDAEMLATKRDARRWPLSYLCSAIGRGKWDPNAKKLCEEHGIDVDWTMREFA